MSRKGQDIEPYVDEDVYRAMIAARPDTTEKEG